MTNLVVKSFVQDPKHPLRPKILTTECVLSKKNNLRFKKIVQKLYFKMETKQDTPVTTSVTKAKIARFNRN